MSCFFIPKHSSYNPDSHLHHLIHQHNKKVLPLTFAFSSHFILLLRMVFNRTHIVFISLHICVEPHDQHVPINHAFFFASFFVCATVFSRSRIFSFFFFYLIFCVCSTAITRSRIFFFYLLLHVATHSAGERSISHTSFIFFLPLALSARYGHQPVSHLLFFFFTSFVCVRALPSPHMYIYIYFSPHA